VTVCLPKSELRAHPLYLSVAVCLPAGRAVRACACGAMADFLATLKGEIAAKKRTLAAVAGERTYVKLGDLEAQRQRQYEEEQRQREEKRQVHTLARACMCVGGGSY
jgi:hypothetical protein